MQGANKHAARDTLQVTLANFGHPCAVSLMLC